MPNGYRGGYVSITFRFQNLLGDLKERYSTELPSNIEKENYINHCINAINRVYELNKDISPIILVTADSMRFLSRAREMKYVYVIPGEVTHMDYIGDKGGLNHIKDFLDLFMISNANHVYTYSFGRMYKWSKFAKTAALIGNKPYTAIEDK